MTRLSACALISALLLPVAPAAADPLFEEIKVSAGAALYQARCQRCHMPDATDPSYGPPLVDILGRRAGSHEGYAYSDAMRASGISWTPGALRAWIEDNDRFMPGTKMRHVGITDPTVQDFILAYLTSISAPMPAAEPGAANPAPAPN